jgi:catechol 2,3-dioxygenase-like lactoylglutathione lyase family enzyme
VLSHVHIGVDDFARALAFYGRVLATLGLSLKFQDPDRRWAGWVQPGTVRPLFLVGVPENGKTAAPGNGQMVALLAPTRDAVDRCHAEALAAGATCAGAPGLRPQYHPDYYGAYFRDPDGNKLCVCCHEAEA